MLNRFSTFLKSTAAPAAPGAMPAYSSNGTVTGTNVLQATHSLVYPATITAGDLLILVAWGQESGAGPTLTLHADAISAGFTNITGSPFTNTGSAAGDYQLLVAWKIAGGGEDGTTLTNAVTATGGTSTDGFHGFIFRMTAADGFAAMPIESIVSDLDNASLAQSQGGPTITPTDVNRRGVSIMAGNNDPTGVGVYAGASGGTWVEAFESNSTFGVGGMFIQIQTCDLSAGNAISGGTMTWTGGTNVIQVAFAAVPANV